MEDEERTATPTPIFAVEKRVKLESDDGDNVHDYNRKSELLSKILRRRKKASAVILSRVAQDLPLSAYSERELDEINAKTFQWEWVATLATIISNVAVLPQFVIILQRGSACDISFAALLVSLVSSILWLLFGLKNKINATVVNRLIATAGSVLFIVIKLYFDSRNHWCTQENEAETEENREEQETGSISEFPDTAVPKQTTKES